MLLFKVSSIVKQTEYFIKQVYQFFISLVKILIISKFNIKIPQATHESCVILGNGPSLRDTFKKHHDMLLKADLFCVNNFATSKEFKEYKPGNFVLLDPGFFKFKTRKDIVDTFNVLKNEVTWSMNLFVPYMFRKDPDVQHLLKSKYVKVCFYNYTIMKGPEKWIFPFFKRNISFPQFYNVLGPSILLAINSGYKNVYMVGADHSWFENIYVRNDNVLCRKDVHFYDNDKEEVRYVPMIEPVSGKVVSITLFFWAQYEVFKSYNLMENYSKYAGSKIYNASESSYIDAFERKSLESYV